MTDLRVPAYSDGDVDTNHSTQPSLNDIVAQRYSRRQTLIGGVRAAAVAIAAGSILTACGDDEDNGGGQAPQVSAGDNATVAAGTMVALRGSATDDGSIASMEWSQDSGLTVDLEDADTDTATFVAPAVAASTDLVFSFTATDDDGQTATDTTTITVTPAALAFEAVAKNKSDVVTVPEGYALSVLYALGDPIDGNTPAYRNDGTDASFERRAGDHHDALYWFGLDAAGAARDDAGSAVGLLVMNHENITQDYLHPNGATTLPDGSRPEAEARKEMLAHGLSVIEVRAANGWSVNRNSSFNRRITPLTPMSFHGPAAGNALLRTQFSPDGTEGRGTINNCANGHTAWGTNLTCEENWAFYFKRDPAVDDPARTPKEVTGLSRYGVRSSTGNYGWTTVQPADPLDTSYARWNAQVMGADATTDFRNEPNQFGWVVEIDPYDPNSTPRKRTALGRMGHEGCWPSRFIEDVRPAFYMGDDSRREYLYKFVSNTPWDPADADAADRLAVGDKYLDDGTLYVAKFNADGTGEWLALEFGQNGIGAGSAAYPFANQADVLVHTRLAADTAGATPMDRPEWTAVNPMTGEMYLTLTNNNASNRPIDDTDAANPRHYNDPKNGADQYGNPNGHILRLAETGGSSEAVTFEWDIYAFGAGSDLDADDVNISDLDDSNDFSSPDGLWFSRPSNLGGQGLPLLWIQTDDGAYADVTNCMMLVGQPGEVGDGGEVTITNRASDGTTAQQQTIVGAAPGTSLRRFLVGPVECEVTGVTSTPDGKTLFVNIQHPGEDGDPANPTSNWPASQNGGGGGSRPRSATIVITKEDGGIVGF